MPEGKIVELRESYGFIEPSQGGGKVFFHRSSLENARFGDLQLGMVVDYEAEEGPKGLRATVVRMHEYRFLNPYNFVRFLDKSRRDNHVLGDCPPPPHDRYVGLTGHITGKVEAVAPLFVSDSHAIKEENNHKTYRFFQVDGQPAIPASSLRGMVRAVFEAVTNSCFVVFDGEKRLSYRDIDAARRMKPGIVQTLARADEPGMIALCKEAAVGAYPGRKKPIVLDSSWQTGEKGFAIIQRPKRGIPFVVALGKTREEISAKGEVVEGWLKITGRNLETKWSERFFYQPETDATRWVKFDLQKQQDYNEVLSRQSKEPGFSSTHQHATLTPGDLVYVELEEDNKTVKNIAATKVPRLLYRTSIGELLRPNHLQRCEKFNTLCPACRVFGWVQRDAKESNTDEPTAYAGRVCFSHGTLVESKGELLETPLTILSTPKPTTTPFYLLNSEGRPEATVDYDTADAQLRGRKFYRHHGEMLSEREYRRTDDIKDDQNRTVKGALKPGAVFEFTIDFENLAPLELGALLYALELEEGMFHRLGYAKPLGFGSVKVTVEKVRIIDWKDRLSKVDLWAGWQELENWPEYKTKFMLEMKNLYGENYENIVLADLRALLEKPPKLPIHYPRSQGAPDSEGKNYEWFVGNKRRIEAQKRGKSALPAPCTLPLASEERGRRGLPLIDRNGIGGSCE